MSGTEMTMRFFHAIALVVVITSTAFVSVCLAETTVITTEASYTMGDGESPSFAEAQVLQKAKQSALEQAGTYVEAYTKTQNYDLTIEEIQTLAGGVMKVEVVEKTRTLVGEGLRFYTKINATVTTDKMQELAQRIRGKNVAEEYQKLQAEYARLSRELETLKQVTSGPATGAERQTARDRIKENEKTFAQVQENEATLFRRLEANAVLLDQIKKLDVQGVTQALKDGANPNAVQDSPISPNTRASSALGILALYGGIQAMDEKSDAKQKSKTEDTAMTIANALFAHGAKLSNIYDHEILFLPISEGWAKFTELLIKNGADPRSKIEGRSPLEWAIHYNQPKVAEVLRAHGIPNVDTKKATLIRFISAADRNDIDEMNRLGREGGIDINAKDDRGVTALIVALPNSHYRTIKLLLELGADPNVTGESLFTDLEGIPIHLAVAMNVNPLVIKDLLKHGGKVAHRDSSGRTALHIAAKHDKLVAAEILIAHGATIMPRDNSGRTPLDYAESAAMINFLKSHGATELNR